MGKNEIINWFLTIGVCLSILAAGCVPSGEKPAKIEHGGEPAELVEPRPSSVVRPPSSDESRVEVEPQRETPPGILLALKFTQGDSTTYKVVTEAQRKMRGEGALQEDDKFRGGITSNRAELTFTQQIQSVDAQGNAVAKITIDKLKYSAQVKNNLTADFDSTRERDKNNSLYKLIGQSYTIEITPEGQVSRVIDVSQARAAVSSSPSVSRDALMLLKPEAIKLRHTIPALPAAEKNKLRQGDSWNNVKPFDFGMMGSKNYERIYTLKEVEDVGNRQTALVEMSAIPSAGTAEEAQQSQAMGIFSKMFDNTETYTGELKLDLNTGKVKEYFEKLQSEWVAVDPEAGKKAGGQPAALRMTATRFCHIEQVD